MRFRSDTACLNTSSSLAALPSKMAPAGRKAAEGEEGSAPLLTASARPLAAPEPPLPPGPCKTLAGSHGVRRGSSGGSQAPVGPGPTRGRRPLAARPRPGHGAAPAFCRPRLPHPRLRSPAPGPRRGEGLASPVTGEGAGLATGPTFCRPLRRCRGRCLTGQRFYRGSQASRKGEARICVQ